MRGAPPPTSFLTPHGRRVRSTDSSPIDSIPDNRVTRFGHSERVNDCPDGTDRDEALRVERVSRYWMSVLVRALVRGTRPEGAIDVDDAPSAWWCPNTVDSRSIKTWKNVDDDSRHAGRCIGGACGNWSGFCRVGAAVAVAGPLRTSTSVSDRGLDCVIRNRCRWRAENGPASCAGCPELRWGTALDNLSGRDVTPSVPPIGPCEN